MVGAISAPQAFVASALYPSTASHLRDEMKDILQARMSPTRRFVTFPYYFLYY